MADAAGYRQDADQTRKAQKDQKRQSRGIAMDWLLKDNGENIWTGVACLLIGNYIANYTGAWTFQDVGEEFNGFREVVTGMFA